MSNNVRIKHTNLTTAKMKSIRQFTDSPPVSLSRTKAASRYDLLINHFIQRNFPLCLSYALTYYAPRNSITIMIRSFRCRFTEALFNDRDTPRFRSIERIARRKLLYLHRARQLADLRVSPGNRLESLKGDRKGQYSIRINDQFRICFVWLNGDASDVEIVDYH